MAGGAFQEGLYYLTVVLLGKQVLTAKSWLGNGPDVMYNGFYEH